MHSGNYTSHSKEEEKMKLNLKALTVTFAILWAGVVFIVGVANVVWPGYGRAFLQMMASIYPGYAASGSFGDVRLRRFSLHDFPFTIRRITADRHKIACGFWVWIAAASQYFRCSACYFSEKHFLCDFLPRFDK
jgi:hypothetical protein